MDKVNKLTEFLYEEDLSSAGNLLEEILRDKIAKRLSEKKIEISRFCLEGNPETKKIAKRLYRKVGKMSREMGDNPRSITAAGRKLFSITPPEKLKAMLAVEGWTKIENKKVKKEIEKRIKDNLKQSHMAGDVSGRMQMKLLPSDIIKKYSKKPESKNWAREISLYKEDKNPTRIKNSQAEKLLTRSGYVKVRSGEHQSIWKHPTDKTKELFPLPHHSKELSPGLTRKLFSLATEEVLQDFITNPENND